MVAKDPPQGGVAGKVPTGPCSVIVPEPAASAPETEVVKLTVYVTWVAHAASEVTAREMPVRSWAGGVTV